MGRAIFFGEKEKATSTTGHHLRGMGQLVIALLFELLEA